MLEVAEDAVFKAGLLTDGSNAVIAKTEATWNESLAFEA